MTSALSLAPPATNKNKMAQATLAPWRSGERSRSPKGRARAAAWVPPVKGWTIAERLPVGDLGVHAANLSFKNQPIVLGFTNLHSPFNASSFNPTDVRKTLTLRLPRRLRARHDRRADVILAIEAIPVLTTARPHPPARLGRLARGGLLRLTRGPLRRETLPPVFRLNLPCMAARSPPSQYARAGFLS